MTTFSVRVYDRNQNPILAPSEVSMKPVGWSAAAVGGPVAAEVALSGEAGALLSLASWLGYGLEIYNDDGQIVWWGQIVTLEVASDGVRRGLSIGEVVNRLQLIFVRQLAGGLEEAASTDWIESAPSIALYGERQRIYSAGTMTQAQADAMAAMLLARLATPQRSLQIEGSSKSGRVEVAAGVLRCVGWYARLGDIYYTNPSGLEGYDPTSIIAQPVGLGFSSVYLGFSTRQGRLYMHEALGKLGAFSQYRNLLVRVSGTTSNNGARTIETGDNQEAESYTSTGVSFDPSDDIRDVNQGLAFIETDEMIWLTGATNSANNGAHLVKTIGAVSIEISPGWSNTIVEEAAGNTITIYRGNRVTITSGVTNERPNGSTSETVQAYGQMVYQTFALPINVSWTVAAIDVRVRKVGATIGVDGLRVGFYTDSSGSPGTLLQAVTINDSDLPVNESWVRFTFNNTNTLNYGTTYGIRIDRTSGSDHENYYEIYVDPAGSYNRGALTMYDGAAWQSVPGDLAFRVVGTIDSMALATDVITQASTEINRTIVEAASGVQAWQYATGEETAAAVLERLLSQGDSSNRRLLARVEPSLTIRIYAQGYDYNSYMRLENGRPTWMDGAPVGEGVLPAGLWLQLVDAPMLSDAWAGLSQVFVERAAYRVGSGWTLEEEGQRSIVERLGVRQG